MTRSGRPMTAVDGDWDLPNLHTLADVPQASDSARAGDAFGDGRSVAQDTDRGAKSTSIRVRMTTLEHG
ncbi:hypothetical protein ACERIT_12880 [Halopenitus sp. H-Gu1]|uniref:hypothetical protein n=1 Tax=Halopenitus sp. H-Gu1 TaxID=3242697 RepID=UPI00359EF964